MRLTMRVQLKHFSGSYQPIRADSRCSEHSRRADCSARDSGALLVVELREARHAGAVGTWSGFPYFLRENVVINITFDESGFPADVLGTSGGPESAFTDRLPETVVMECYSDMYE